MPELQNLHIAGEDCTSLDDSVRSSRDAPPCRRDVGAYFSKYEPHSVLGYCRRPETALWQLSCEWNEERCNEWCPSPGFVSAYGDRERCVVNVICARFRRLAPSVKLYFEIPLERPEGLDNQLETTFRSLADCWRRETAVLSSITAKAMHPAYQQIIGMGPSAVPLILRELRRRLDHWFWALKAITGEEPVPPEDAGDMERMREAWLRFGEQRRYL